MKGSLPPSATLRLEHVLCGRPKCTKLHGPYWYGYFTERGRTRKIYIGAKLTPELVRRRLNERPGKRGSKHDARVMSDLQLELLMVVGD